MIFACRSQTKLKLQFKVTTQEDATAEATIYLLLSPALPFYYLRQLLGSRVVSQYTPALPTEVTHQYLDYF